MKTNYFTSVKSTAILSLLVFLLTACEKEIAVSLPPGSNPPTTSPIAKEIAVKFSAATIPMDQLDSAVIVVRDADKNIVKWETMQKVSDSLVVNLSSLGSGDYAAEIMIYTKKGSDNTARQYYLQKLFTFPLQQALREAAPTGKFNDAWFKRAIFFADQNEAIIIVAMHPGDAAYEVRFKEPVWTSIAIERYSINTNHLVAMKNYHKKFEGKLVGLVEYFAFESYVDSMRGKEWTRGHISVSVRHESGSYIDFHCEYDKS